MHFIAGAAAMPCGLCQSPTFHVVTICISLPSSEVLEARNVASSQQQNRGRWTMRHALPGSKNRAQLNLSNMHQPADARQIRFYLAIYSVEI
jgi:hypothetical protein